MTKNKSPKKVALSKGILFGFVMGLIILIYEVIDSGGLNADVIGDALVSFVIYSIIGSVVLWGVFKSKK